MNNKQHHQKRRVVSIPGVAHALWWLVVACFLPSLVSAAESGVCAQVKIEIKQELTLERQAFDAVMKITNGLEITAGTTGASGIRGCNASSRPEIIEALTPSTRRASVACWIGWMPLPVPGT